MVRRLSIAILMLLATAAVARAADWPDWRGPNLDRHYS
jgi:hypothetical protein